MTNRSSAGAWTSNGLTGTSCSPPVFVPAAVGLAVFNLALLLIGGAKWGAAVFGVGAALMLTFVPFYALRLRHSLGPPEA